MLRHGPIQVPERLLIQWQRLIDSHSYVILLDLFGPAARRRDVGAHVVELLTQHIERDRLVFTVKVIQQHVASRDHSLSSLAAPHFLAAIGHAVRIHVRGHRVLAQHPPHVLHALGLLKKILIVGL